jgi:rhamnose utilization protein RhaD (predicted bifunctional aldolase and dehydrogenase)
MAMMTPVNAEPLAQLLDLSHDLGREDRRLAILGEGNTSVRLASGDFLVKASGGNLATLSARGVSHCRGEGLLALLGQNGATDAACEQALLQARVDPAANKPSVEAMFHAWLLTLPGINFVGHTHPVAVNALVCSPRASAFAQQRLFPDEIVCCGGESVLVPYTDPGLPLAQAIQQRVAAFMARTSVVPRLVLLENHGMIAIGGTAKAVLATTLMAVKAAEVTLGAVAAGGPVYLTPEQVRRIAGRSDEHYRQKALGL